MDTAGSPAERLLALGEMVFTAWALQAVAELGIADHMGGEARPAAELAALTGTQADALTRTLRLLAMHGVVTETRPGSFALTDTGRLLRTDDPASQRAWFVMGAPLNKTLFDAPLESLRTGRPTFERAIGVPFFELGRVDRSWGEAFDAAMASVGHQTARDVVGAYDFSGGLRIVDVGGGSGTLIARILGAEPSTSGVIVDQPAVVERARDVLAAAGVLDRCELVGGDFFVRVPDGGDRYLLSWILHDWDDTDAIRTLRCCRAAMGVTSRVVIVEIDSPVGDASHVARSMDLAMLVGLGGRERTAAEYGALLDAAGLHLERVIPTAGPMSIFEARPA